MKRFFFIPIFLLFLGLCNFKPLARKKQIALFTCPEVKDSIIAQITYLKEDSSEFVWRENKIRNPFYYRTDTFKLKNEIGYIRINNAWKMLFDKRNNHVQSHSLSYALTRKGTRDSVVYQPIAPLILNRDTLYGFSYTHFQKYKITVGFGGISSGYDDSVRYCKRFFSSCPDYTDAYYTLYCDHIYFDAKKGISVISLYFVGKSIRPVMQEDSSFVYYLGAGYFDYQRDWSQLKGQQLLKNKKLPKCDEID